MEEAPSSSTPTVMNIETETKLETNPKTETETEMEPETETTIELAPELGTQSVCSVRSVQSVRSVRSALGSALDVGNTAVALDRALYVAVDGFVPRAVQRVINDCRLLHLAFRKDVAHALRVPGTWCITPRAHAATRSFETQLCVRVAQADGTVVTLDATCGEDGTWFVPGRQLRKVSSSSAAALSSDTKFTSLAALVSHILPCKVTTTALHGVLHWVPPRVRSDELADANRLTIAAQDAPPFQLHHVALRSVPGGGLLGFHIASQLAFCVGVAGTHVHVSLDMRAAIEAARAYAHTGDNKT
jgi:hypothetical protein